MQADITISGRVGAEVEWRDHERYDGRASFNVAVTPRIQRDGVWVDQPTTWYRVTCWRRLALNVRDSLGTGDAVLVGGRLRLDRWQDEHGQPREAWAIDATWVAHDLRRGTTAFTRSRLRADPDEPTESDHERERLDAESGLGLTGAGAEVSEGADADGVRLSA